MMKLHYSPLLVDELKQKQAITTHLINKILYSKRLLIDHLEALEQCMLHVQDVAAVVNNIEHKNDSDLHANNSLTEYFTARNACILLGTTIVEHLITPKPLRFTLLPSLLLTTGFSVVYMVKNAFVFRNKIVERELENVIQTIDEFGNCIRRNMTYFNEILIMKQQELVESRQIERAWDCITSAKEVTEILYDATLKLESHFPLPAKFLQYYSPMEQLRECEYFKTNVTDYSPKHIKDFYNIFAYVQSQFLLRLALAILTKPSISQLNTELVKIDCLIKQLVNEEENHFKNLSIELAKKKQLDLETLNSSKAMQNRSGPIAVLQDSSLKLSARMVAVAGECQALDITLQRLTESEAIHKDSAKQLVQVATNMRSIENALSICFDDFQRLMLVYNKFLSSKLGNKEVDFENCESVKNNENKDEYPESFLRVEISQSLNENENKDDFYAYMFDKKQTTDEKNLEESASTHDMEISNCERRITRVKFRPVLKQLKNRIDPIREEMLEKERKVLLSKGINVDELFDKEENAAATQDISESESEGSADLEFEKRTKKIKDRDNFAEMRNFLAQKDAINLFQLGEVPHSGTGISKEDILE